MNNPKCTRTSSDTSVHHGHLAMCSSDPARFDIRDLIDKDVLASG